ncbi:MAG: 4-alpha-glucanotransferase [Methanoregula sp.]|nr:4-alpha-glucanotransferase [Methanoregula sp.]
MKQRGSGILLHITSLFSPYGIGDLGPAAYRFVDFLSDARQSYWQILPLNPTRPEYDNSPYLSTSAFGFNTLLISPDCMERDGFLHKSDIERIPEFSEGFVDFNAAIRFKEHIFAIAFDRFQREKNGITGYDEFCRNNETWLEDFALFTALHRHYGGSIWSSWPDEIKFRDPAALDAMRLGLKDMIDREKFLQYIFFTQWMALRGYSRKKGIGLIGDIPIYVNYHSADVWTHPALFQLDENLEPLVVAGVPPDYFSRTGQLWKNPLYCWAEHEKEEFSWWINRVGHNLMLFDITRIDHFRGLVAYWEVRAGEKDAINGRWVPAPGEKLLTVMKRRFVSLPIIAEDLGIITPDVSELIDRFDLPGMRVLLFAFTDDPSTSPHAPHNLERNCVLYTGTHDNATTRGWLESDATPDEKSRLFQYLGQKIPAEQLPAALIRLAMMSVADSVIFPMQDILGRGEKSRMNRPGTDEGNWRWQMEKDEIDLAITRDLALMTQVFGRNPGGKIHDSDNHNRA